jgi:hypothetical protein
MEGVAGRDDDGGVDRVDQAGRTTRLVAGLGVAYPLALNIGDQVDKQVHETRDGHHHMMIHRIHRVHEDHGDLDSRDRREPLARCTRARQAGMGKNHQIRMDMEGNGTDDLITII